MAVVVVVVVAVAAAAGVGVGKGQIEGHLDGDEADEAGAGAAGQRCPAGCR